jgi:hypothetical protein
MSPTFCAFAQSGFRNPQLRVARTALPINFFPRAEAFREFYRRERGARGGFLGLETSSVIPLQIGEHKVTEIVFAAHNHHSAVGQDGRRESVE